MAAGTLGRGRKGASKICINPDFILHNVKDNFSLKSASWGGHSMGNGRISGSRGITKSLFVST